MLLSELIAKVKRLKRSAKSNTTIGTYQLALDDLEEAVNLLLSEEKKIDIHEIANVELEENPYYQIIAQLADCYGMLGGVYRRMAKKDRSSFNKFIDDAIKMYDKGYEYEEKASYYVASSYNLINTIVIRLLKNANNLETQREKIQRSIEIIEKQIEVERKDEWWAWGDLGELYILSGKSKEAHHAYERFRNTGANASGYVSTIEVLNELKETLTPAYPDMVKEISSIVRELEDNKPLR